MRRTFLEKKVHGFEKYLGSLSGRRREGDYTFSFRHVIPYSYGTLKQRSWVVKYVGLTEAHQKDNSWGLIPWIRFFHMEVVSEATSM